MTAGSGASVLLLVGALAVRDEELLLVRRGRGAAGGEWSLPGGEVRFGEDLREAAVRAVADETALEVVVSGFAGWAEHVDVEADPPHHHVLLYFVVDPLDPLQLPSAGEGAAEVDWVPVDDLQELRLAEGVAEFLTDAGVLVTEPEVELPSP